MKLKLLSVIVLFLFGSFCTINAQVINGYVKSKAKTATNRAAQNTDKEVDSQINKAVDKQFNKLKEKVLDKDEEPSESQGVTEEVNDSEVTGPESKSSSGSSGDDAMSKAFMGKMGINMERPANMKDLYEYSGNIKMDVETWNDEGESQGTVEYTTQFSDKNNGIAMEFKDNTKGNSVMIFDYDNQLMLILGDDGKDKNGFATPLAGYQPDSVSTSGNNQDTETNTNDVENYYSAFKKTGKTKTIAGYNCEEYYFENEEDMISYWIATDLPAELWTRMGHSGIFSPVYAGRTNGFVMESDEQSKTSKGRTHMLVKEVNEKQPGRISTTGYTIMTMNAPPAAKEEKAKDKEE